MCPICLLPREIIGDCLTVPHSATLLFSRQDIPLTTVPLRATHLHKAVMESVVTSALLYGNIPRRHLPEGFGMMVEGLDKTQRGGRT